MKKIILSIVSATMATISLNAQNVNIPDASFKAYLVANTAINTNADTEIQVSEASAFTGLISINSFVISDLTGIEAFTSLTYLSCQFNDLTSLNVSANVALTYLACGANSLSTLDVTNNTALQTLYCAFNDLTNLDLSLNSNLQALNCQNNLLTAFNVANGNNVNVSGFEAINNPNLTCIEVDDVSYSTTNWTTIDAGASFSLDCGSSASITENSTIELSIYPNPASNVITVNTSSQIEEVNVYDTYGNLVNTFNASTFSVSHLCAGIYFLTVSTDKGTNQQKFIKE